MIPDGLANDNPIYTTDDVEVQPSYTYNFDFDAGRIIGKTDQHNAIVQFCRKVLNTPRYVHEIYDWLYGSEVFTLIGKDYPFVEIDVVRIVREALLQDERIVEVFDFEIEQTGADRCLISFKVRSIFSDVITVRQEVEI